MKLLDDVKVINDKYKNEGISMGMIGTIIDADIKWNSFYVCFQDPRITDKNFMSNEENFKLLKNDICCAIKIEDLELVKDGNCTDETIKNSLPENHKDWWCKVENGFIINLDGKKKNKIAYNYKT